MCSIVDIMEARQRGRGLVYGSGVWGRDGFHLMMGNLHFVHEDSFVSALSEATLKFHVFVELES